MGSSARLLALALLIGVAPTVAAVAASPDGAVGGQDGGETADDFEEEDFLSRIRRLTYEGRRAGEGYFSADGTAMVLQSERTPGNPFFQIYRLDLETGESERISPGVGKTTCAFFHPVTGDIEFASSHLDPEAEKEQRQELEMRASGEERRYSWDYDPWMDIFVSDAETGELRQLTDAHGYDAEGSYSPDGSKIVFTSNRHAFQEDLSERQEELLEVDPAYFAEIWIMNSDGTDQTRLTRVPGYDGGPFFFPDGSRIVWRRFDESGLIADVWSMRPDGSDARQITDFGAMSWAPYVHPSGEYVLFASNKLGFENFEIFIVDTAGQKEPVQVTHTAGFDGLPVPSPDGTMLSWTSQRHGDDHGQIYLADWNHEAALRALEAAPARMPHDGDR